MFKKKVELKPMVVSTKIYTITEETFSDGKCKMKREAIGFNNDFELFGMLKIVVEEHQLSIVTKMVNGEKNKK